jgi:hypothetical protein
MVMAWELSAAGQLHATILDAPLTQLALTRLTTRSALSSELRAALSNAPKTT